MCLTSGGFLKVTWQTHAANNFYLCRWGAEHQACTDTGERPIGITRTYHNKSAENQIKSTADLNQ